MIRTAYLRNKFIDSKTDAYRLAYKSEHNCVSLTRNEKTTYFSNFKISDVKCNKPFAEKYDFFL